MIYKIVVENVKTHEVIRKYKTKISTMEELTSIVDYYTKSNGHAALFLNHLKEYEIYVLVSVREQ